MTCGIPALDTALLVALTVSALWTVMARSVLRSAIGLAAVSIIVTIIMFRLGTHLAAVFELSVCAGLITVVFASTISLVNPLTERELAERQKKRLKKYLLLPVLSIGIGAAFFFALNLPGKVTAIAPAVMELDFKKLYWELRQTDLLGQIVILLAGVFGIIVLFKEPLEKPK